MERRRSNVDETTIVLHYEDGMLIATSWKIASF